MKEYEELYLHCTVGGDFSVKRRVLGDGFRRICIDDGGRKTARGHHHHLDGHGVGEWCVALVRGPRRELEDLDAGLGERVRKDLGGTEEKQRV